MKGMLYGVENCSTIYGQKRLNRFYPVPMKLSGWPRKRGISYKDGLALGAAQGHFGLKRFLDLHDLPAFRQSGIKTADPLHSTAALLPVGRVRAAKQQGHPGDPTCWNQTSFSEIFYTSRHSAIANAHFPGL